MFVGRHALDQLPSEVVMTVDDVVDAAIAGFDQGELVTIPWVPDIADWEAYEAARSHFSPGAGTVRASWEPLRTCRGR
jgi:hypothetical protein